MPPRRRKHSPAPQPEAPRPAASAPRWRMVRKADGGMAAERLGVDGNRAQALADLYGDTPMLSTGANMRRVSSIMAELLSRLQIKEAEIAPELLAQSWHSAVGDFLATQAELSSLSEGLAIVRTAHPAVRFELQRRKADIIRALNRTLGEGCVRAVRIVHGG